MDDFDSSDTEASTQKQPAEEAWTDWFTPTLRRHGPNEARRPTLYRESHPILSTVVEKGWIEWELKYGGETRRGIACQRRGGHFFLRGLILPEGWPALPNNTDYRMRIRVTPEPLGATVRRIRSVIAETVTPFASTEILGHGAEAREQDITESAIPALIISTDERMCVLSVAVRPERFLIHEYDASGDVRASELRGGANAEGWLEEVLALPGARALISDRQFLTLWAKGGARVDESIMLLLDALRSLPRLMETENGQAEGEPKPKRRAV